MAEPFRITEPGFYPDISSADYFADPCPQPSLTQSVAKILLERSPLHAWHAHPRLNPDYQPDNDTKFDVGNIAHKLMLGRGKDIVVLEFDDWRTKAAKDQRDLAAAGGKLAVLGKHYSKATRMVKAAREQIANIGGYDMLFDPAHGYGEQVIAWREDTMWCRQMIDWLNADYSIFADYKTTQMCAAADVLGRQMASAGWPIQAAMADRGLNVLDPDGKDNRIYLFVVQEDTPPYALNVVEISKDVMMLGAKRLDIAVRMWRKAFADNRWPGYPPRIVTPEMPSWAEQQWLDREIVDAAQQRVPARHADNLMAG